MIAISSENYVLIDGIDTGLKATQDGNQTIICTPEKTGQRYLRHDMPFKKYAFEFQGYHSNIPGMIRFESDIRLLLKILIPF